MHVSILGLGPSVHQFQLLAQRVGGRRALCDQVWGINALGDVFACDLVFHMDDVRVQMIRAAADPGSNIARMVEWLRGYQGRVITSRKHPDFACLEEFPLAKVIEAYPCGYFNSTAAYAIAYAIHKGAKKITVFGMDFTYPDAHEAEKGRACVEFWLGIAHARGIQLSIPKTSTLMDSMYPALGVDRFYGYDCVELDVKRTPAGRIKVSYTDREKMPTAEEIEARYDHSVHPNPLVAEKT
jgi:hypothetical protein